MFLPDTSGSSSPLTSILASRPGSAFLQVGVLQDGWCGAAQPLWIWVSVNRGCVGVGNVFFRAAFAAVPTNVEDFFQASEEPSTDPLYSRHHSQSVTFKRNHISMGTLEDCRLRCLNTLDVSLLILCIILNITPHLPTQKLFYIMVYNNPVSTISCCFQGM